MAYAFISYARHDRPFVERLTRDLRASGIDTWTDLERIAPGAWWQAEIEKALRGASVLLYVGSGHAGRSKWMEHVLLAGLDSKIPIIPLITDDEGQQNLSAYLLPFQWVDFRSSYESGVALLIDGIRHLRGGEPLPHERPKSKGYAFISYAEEDQTFVRKLSTFMKEHGYGLWEFQSSDRNYHSELYEELEGVIREASATLCIVSPHWKKSKTTKQEFFFSRDIGVPVFLLRVADPGPTLALAGLPYIDFSRDEAQAFARLDKELKRRGL